METTILQDPDLTVAIDIGTTYSGYAFQWKQDFQHNNRNVEFNTNWGEGALQLHKTKTCILLNENKQADSIGSLAERRYCAEVDKDPDHIHGKWFFFEYFKDHLYDGNGQNICEKIEDHSGQCLPFKEVLSLFIGALKDHFINNLKEKHGKGCPKKTLWVLTVPVLWSDKAKKFVRDAAEASGIKRQHLLLALEPECAAIYCINMPIEQRGRMNHVGEIGDQFVTVDTGGGTLDVTAIKVLKDGFLDELCSVQGASVGGNDVNNAFKQACKDVLDGDAWHNTFTEKNATDLFTFLNEFEQKKVSIGSERDEYISLTIPHSLRDMLKNGKVQVKPEAKYQKYFNTESGKFQFKSELVREILFKEVLDEMLVPLKGILAKEELRHVRTLVLVGGFAESHIVRDTIRSQLKEQYPSLVVVAPTSPSRAVMMGAIAYGFNPRIFRSRIARATYGVRVVDRFDPEKHRSEYKKTYKGDAKEYCQNIFSIHVQKDQSVILFDKQPSRTYNPARAQQTKLMIRIFTSTEQNPLYTTDASCKELGNIVVHCPDTSRGTDRGVEVTMVYGGTELTVIANDETTGQEYETDITFD